MTPSQAELFLAALSRLTNEVQRVANALEKKQHETPKQYTGAVSKKQLKYIRDLRESLSDSSTEEPETSSEASELIKELKERLKKKETKQRQPATRAPEPEPEPEDRSDIDPERNRRRIAEHLARWQT